MDPNTAELIRKGIEEREHTTNDPAIRGIVRVEVSVEDGLTYRAHTPSEPQFVLTIDEPRERGGGGQGPSPLVYFLTGAATCLLNQFIRLAVARDIDVQFEAMSARGERDRGIGGAFRHITQEVYARGSASQQQVEELTAQAEAFCYVHATLSKSVAMTTVVHVNGREVVRRTSEPPAIVAA